MNILCDNSLYTTIPPELEEPIYDYDPFFDFDIYTFEEDYGEIYDELYGDELNRYNDIEFII